MRDRTLITTGVVGGALAALCNAVARYRVRSSRPHRLAGQSRLCADPGSNHLSGIDRSRPVPAGACGKTWHMDSYDLMVIG